MSTVNEKYLGEAPLNESPTRALRWVIADNSVTTPKIRDNAVTTEKINDRAVTPEKLSVRVTNEIIQPAIQTLRDKDRDLQNQIDSLQIHGLAVSNMFGNDSHIGISQNTLTNIIGRIWEVLGEIKGKNYLDFTLIVNEGTAQVNIIADCTDAISYFDSIKIYVNDVLVDEAECVNLLRTVVDIDGTSNIKAVGIIIGKTIIKEKTVIHETPFFIGSAPEDYHDVMTQDNWHKIVGTLEGDYNFSVKNDNDHIFVIIPISRKEEYRRCRLDMNGFEIPFDVTETSDLIICKSQNTYVRGDYNLDIDINS